jgi:hypothetical protein
MRALFGLLALVGLAGVVFGVVTIIQGGQREAFSYENYGGPGPIIAGMLLLSVSLYLFSVWPRMEAGSREVHRR